MERKLLVLLAFFLSGCVTTPVPADQFLLPPVESVNDTSVYIPPPAEPPPESVIVSPPPELPLLSIDGDFRSDSSNPDIPVLLRDPVGIPPHGLTECLFTPQGERVKVLCGKNLITVKPFLGREGQDVELSALKPYFVLSESNSGGSSFYLIEPVPLRSKALISVASNQTVRWETNLGIRRVNDITPVYATLAEALEAYLNGTRGAPLGAVRNYQTVHPVIRWEPSDQYDTCQIVYVNQDDGQLNFGWVVVPKDRSRAELLAHLGFNELRILLANLHLLEEVLRNPNLFPSLPDHNSGLLYRQVPSQLIFLTDESSLGMDVWLMVRGLPMKADSVLALTKADVETMSQIDRLRLAEYLSATVISRLENELSSADWCHGIATQPFGWIRYVFLP